MKNQTIKYYETQNSTLINILMLLAIVFLVLSYIYQWGDTPIPLLATILTSLLFVIILLLFFKLTITIDESRITASFGIGLIKKSIELKNINIQSTEKINTPWYFGIGIRVTRYGILYNTKPGTAIKINYKNSEKAFLIGTDNFEQIKRVLLEK
ncbi:MAG: hypothetical protein PF549_03500 [Patescibacteria group bacterium]|jgi:hypothetical protein|nr:hypothetical protein [Patescibacteria group bacterium]